MALRSRRTLRKLQFAPPGCRAPEVLFYYAALWLVCTLFVVRFLAQVCFSTQSLTRCASAALWLACVLSPCASRVWPVRRHGLREAAHPQRLHPCSVQPEPAFADVPLPPQAGGVQGRQAVLWNVLCLVARCGEPVPCTSNKEESATRTRPQTAVACPARADRPVK